MILTTIVLSMDGVFFIASSAISFSLMCLPPRSEILVVMIILASESLTRSLIASALDERFAVVISSSSGAGGALTTRYYCEQQQAEGIEFITRVFPDWFHPRFRFFCGREDKLPVDQHELIALAAPRPIYVASAEEDRWADPRGEFLSAKNAEPVYRLFDKEGLGVDEMPAVDHPVGNR